MNVSTFTRLFFFLFGASVLNLTSGRAWSKERPQVRRAIDPYVGETAFSSNLLPTDESFSHFTQLQGELPFDKELSIYLFKSETKRFYFQTFSHEANISLTVTPCESALRWELFFINSRSIKKLRKRKVRRSKKYYIRFLARKLANDDANRQLLLNHTGTRRFTYSETSLQAGLYVVQLASEDSTDLSAKVYLSSNTLQPYPKIPPVATVLSKQTYPTTPEPKEGDDEAESGHRKKENATASVELWWNPAIPTEKQPAFLYEYCLLISERRHYRDNCLSMQNNNYEDDVDAEPDSLQLDGIAVGPRYTVKSIDNQINSETEWWHRAARRLLRETLRKDYSDFVVHYACSNTTRATVQQLKPKQTYYVDVFVRNQMTGGTSRYWTANFSLAEPVPKETGREKGGGLTEQPLHDRLFMGVMLEAKNKYQKRLQYTVPPDVDGKSVYIYVQLCDGQGPVQLSVRQAFSTSSDERKRQGDPEGDEQRNEQNMIFGGTHDEQWNDLGVLLLEEFTETKTFEVVLPRAEGNESVVLDFELNTMMHRQSRSVVLLVTSDLNRFPFPRIPQDRAIREFESLRSCNKLTLAWYASPDQRVLYCVLQREFNPDRPTPNFKDSRELCAKIAPVKPAAKRALTGGPDDILVFEMDQSMTPTRKVICRRYKSSKRRRSNLIMQEVRRLNPGKQYIFQVIISKGSKGGRSLNYEQIWAETKETCISKG